MLPAAPPRRGRAKVRREESNTFLRDRRCGRQEESKHERAFPTHRFLSSHEFAPVF